MTSLGVPPAQSEISSAELIAGIGNHEAKALLMLYLGSSAGFQAESPMSTGFREFIGTGADWYPASPGPFSYCRNSLEPIGQVVRGQVESSKAHPISAYGISRYGKDTGIPAAGLLLEWSLDYPDISVQQIFGPTHTKGAIRAPQTRIAVLTRLASSSESLSTAEIAGINPRDWSEPDYRDRLRITDNAIRALARNALVNIERQADDNNRSFRILAIDPPHSSGMQRSISTTAIHNFIRQRHAAGEFEFTTEDCVQHVIAQLKLTDETLDPADVRQRVTNTLASKDQTDEGTAYHAFPSLERLERSYEGNRHTRIALDETYRAAIETLMGIVVSIDSRESQVIAHGRQAAKEIAADEQKKIALLNKAYAFSAAAKKRSIAETGNAIITILESQDGPVDLETILQVYEATHRPASPALIRKVMKDLAKQKNITVISKRSKPSSRTRRHFYALTDT